MSTSISATDIIAKALDGLAARQVATAANIANAGNSSSRPLRVSFEGQLRAAALGGAGSLATVSPTVSYAEASGAPRLDLELVTASTTTARFGALLDVLGRQMALARAIAAMGR